MPLQGAVHVSSAFKKKKGSWRMNGRLGAVKSLTRTAHLAPQLLADSGNNTFGGIALVTDLCK